VLKELQCPGLKALVTGGVKRGVPFNGEMKEGRRSDFFPSAEVAGGDHGGGARPISGGGYLLYVGVGGGRKLAGPGGPARPKTRREIFFELKIGFLNLQRF
jgi:hypothetical protein